MRKDVPRSGDLEHAIEAFERAAERRKTRAARRAAAPVEAAEPPPPPAPTPPRARRVRPALYPVLAVSLSVTIVAAGFFLDAPGPDVAPAGVSPMREPRDTAVDRVVLDPGHGGRDPGAGADHLHEAALVLDVAHRLAARLESETGIEVVLTRQEDVYVSLEARSALANEVGADLFVSIHANASRDRLASGIATYHRRPHRGNHAETGPRATGSRALAELVQRHLIDRIRRLHPEVRDLGVKQERFDVLVDTDMPGVLTEISFLSNQEEAELLSTETYRDRISDALFDSIVAFHPPSAEPLAADD